jgi:hypothetical protein
MPWGDQESNPVLVFNYNPEGYSSKSGSMYGRSIAEINYVYKDVKDESHKKLFHLLTQKSNILVLDSTLTFKDLEIESTFDTVNAPLIKIIGGTFSSITIERATLSLHTPLVLNSVPTSLSIISSSLVFTSTYLVNSKHTSAIYDSSFAFLDSNLTSQQASMSTLPLIYLEGYSSIEISQSSFQIV